ncbi:MAG: ubiquinol-cytochrome c reductase iron-sulfur subunit [Planctomycetes bacterium]|nr:ubiquinol-cytochrome c reductase iron-sulfur subunit [Planctomycetota bacterium]
MSDGPERPPDPLSSSGEPIARRALIARLGVGLAGAAMAMPMLMSGRSLVPNALYEAPRKVKVGPPEHFADGPTFLKEERVFVFREGKVFHCLSAVCTHLGCTVQLMRKERTQEIEFHCPCHGSRYRGDGTNYAGPAPRPLDYLRLELAPDDAQLVVDLAKTEDKGWRFTL